MSTFTSSPTPTLIKVTFTGIAGPGSISVPGLQVGDVVLSGRGYSNPNWAGFETTFESIVSVADQLQQLSYTDFSSAPFTLYLIRGV